MQQRRRSAAAAASTPFARLPHDVMETIAEAAGPAPTGAQQVARQAALHGVPPPRCRCYLLARGQHAGEEAFVALPGDDEPLRRLPAGTSVYCRQLCSSQGGVRLVGRLLDRVANAAATAGRLRLIGLKVTHPRPAALNDEWRRLDPLEGSIRLTAASQGGYRVEVSGRAHGPDAEAQARQATMPDELPERQSLPGEAFAVPRGQSLERAFATARGALLHSLLDAAGFDLELRLDVQHEPGHSFPERLAVPGTSLTLTTAAHRIFDARAESTAVYWAPGELKVVISAFPDK
jgi:hypothetical protein